MKKWFVTLMVTVMAVMAMGPAKALAETYTIEESEAISQMSKVEELGLEYIVSNNPEYRVVKSEYSIAFDGVMQWTLVLYNCDLEQFESDTIYIGFSDLEAEVTYLQVLNAF